jgi:hypothetical protein
VSHAVLALWSDSITEGPGFRLPVCLACHLERVAAVNVGFSRGVTKCTSTGASVLLVTTVKRPGWIQSRPQEGARRQVRASAVRRGAVRRRGTAAAPLPDAARPRQAGARNSKSNARRSKPAETSSRWETCRSRLRARRSHGREKAAQCQVRFCQIHSRSN